jgi:hypothetical protein
VTIDYWLRDKPDSGKLVLEIFDKQGKLVRRYSNTAAPKPGSTQVALSASQGMNRFTWDFRTMPLVEVPNVVIYGADYRGHRVAPGTYRARLTLQGEQRETDIDIRPDPRQPGSSADWSTQQQYLEKAESAINEAHTAVNQVRAWKTQLSAARNNWSSNPGQQDILQAADNLIRKLDAWEANVIETRQKGFQDALNWPSKVNSELFNVRNNTDTHDPRVPAGYKERLTDLLREWDGYLKSYQDDITRAVDDFNRLCREKNVSVLGSRT